MRLFGAQCDKRLLEPPVKPLDHSICFRMVGGGEDDLDAPDPSELLENFRRELGATVGGDGRGDAVILNPAGSKCVDDALSGNVGDWDCYRPSGESVHHGEKVSKPV